jgi:spore maturation protein CgeB
VDGNLIVAGHVVMRMLIAGQWRWPMYEEACANAFSSLGIDVVPFNWSTFFAGKLGRAQHAIPAPGPALLRLNWALVKRAQEVRPDVLFIWRGTHILSSTLRRVKVHTRAQLVSYNNDDPFGPSAHGCVPWHHHHLWRLYIRSLKHYDHNFVYRQVNVAEALQAGARKATVLKPYFVPMLHRPIPLDTEDRARYACDVCFVGHYEPDGRERYLRALVEVGLHVRLYGGRYWTPAVLGDLSSYFGEVRLAYGDAYRKALCGAKMCLSLLSRLNRDTYTRRCLEIPACGCLLLSERTDDLRHMFREDEEAVFFSSHQELVEKALWLKERPQEAVRIAQAGMRRVYADGHSVTERMRELLSMIRTPGQERTGGGA